MSKQIDAAHPEEFALIDRYFKNKTLSRKDVVLGIGDDAALLQLPAQQLLVVAMDTLVAGVHFPVETSAYDIAHKALAVNLSDLAAMGAEPAWLTLAITMPQSDSAWLEDFSNGLFALANHFNMQLVGGDTTRGPLSITIQAHGFVPQGRALLRSGAKPGDKIYVSGTLGDACFGLKMISEKLSLAANVQAYLIERLNRPLPRVALGVGLRAIASSAIDISDGLMADLMHMLEAGKIGANLMTDHLPLSAALRDNLPIDEAKTMALTGGDDYELCFTVSPKNETRLHDLVQDASVDCVCIGVITDQAGIALQDFNGKIDLEGYHHFG